MGQTEQTDRLYDFLYKDLGRLGSYYAQIFGGRLASHERLVSTRDTLGKSSKGGIPLFVQGEATSSQENLTSSKHTIDPHDLIVVNVLASLLGDERVHRDIATAGNGSLVLVQGTLLFWDRTLLQTAGLASRGTLSQSADQSERAAAAAIDAAVALLGSLPSAYFLQAKSGLWAGGTIKDAGMEEPSSAYYFKHGAGGIPDVYLFGIKEVASQNLQLPGSPILEALQKASDLLSNALFPQPAYRVTPLALYRDIVGQGG